MTRYTITIYDAQSALNPYYMLQRFPEEMQRQLSDTVNIEVRAQEVDHCPVCDHEFEVDNSNEDHRAGFCRWECRQSLEDQPGVEDPIGTEEAIDLDLTLYNEDFLQ